MRTAPIKSYKNLYFDLDNTLWDFHTNSKLTLTEIVDRNVPELNSKLADFLEVFYEINDKLWLQYRNGELKKEVLRNKRFEDTLKQLGIDDNPLANKIGDDYIKISPYKTALFPNALQTLEYLKGKGYRMFLLTNGFLEVQVVKIRESKLEIYFDKMITSEEAGYQKPHQKIFEYALKTVNSKKVESIMIGDDLDNDIFGAKRFGMDTVFFNPKKIAHESQPTYEINGLEELRRIL